MLAILLEAVCCKSCTYADEANGLQYIYSHSCTQCHVLYKWSTVIVHIRSEIASAIFDHQKVTGRHDIFERPDVNPCSKSDLTEWLQNTNVTLAITA